MARVALLLSFFTTIVLTTASTGTVNMTRTISKLIHCPMQKEGAGFIVTRSVGSKYLDTFDPFLMLDHFGPKTYGPREAVGAPDHPHRGFETVTYIIQGSFEHRDSQGNHGRLNDGDVQWMTAGSGVVHSEMPSKDMFENGGTSEGFQLWVNLPAAKKMIPPRYQDTPDKNMPRYQHDGVFVKVIAGEAKLPSGDVIGAVIETHTPITVLDIRLDPGSTIEIPIPSEQKCFVYCYRGEGSIGSDSDFMKQRDVVTLKGEGSVKLGASMGNEFRVLLVAGKPIGEPVARYGPFVMNTREELQQAFDDYESGKLGSIDGSEERLAVTREAQAKPTNHKPDL